MSCTNFRVNLHYIACLKVKEFLAQSRCHTLASLATWLSVRLQTKWLWIQITLLSLKLPTLGILFSTALRAVVVAKLVILGVSPLTSFILA